MQILKKIVQKFIPGTDNVLKFHIFICFFNKNRKNLVFDKKRFLDYHKIRNSRKIIS